MNSKFEADDPDVYHMDGIRRRKWLRLVVVATCFALLAVAGITTARNHWGYNISGRVACTNSEVSGVFVQAERLPRVPYGPEVQSGFATWRYAEQHSATFTYWLPYGGRYALHIGCGTLDMRLTWASNNRTAYERNPNPSWRCNEPNNSTYVTIIADDCRKVRL